MISLANLIYEECGLQNQLNHQEAKTSAVYGAMGRKDSCSCMWKSVVWPSRSIVFGPKMVSETILQPLNSSHPSPHSPELQLQLVQLSCLVYSGYCNSSGCLGTYRPQIFLAAPLLEVRNPFKIFCVLSLYTVCLYLCYRQINDDANRTTRNLLILSVNAFISEINYISHSPR